jgi:hypothetical protein
MRTTRNRRHTVQNALAYNKLCNVLTLKVFWDNQAGTAVNDKLVPRINQKWLIPAISEAIFADTDVAKV